MDKRNLFRLSAWRFKLTVISERIRGLDFSTGMSLRELGLDEKNANPYSSSDSKEIKALLDHLLASKTANREDGFLDFGCGKGNVLRIAAKAGFKRIKGVELSEAAAEIARRNMDRLGLRHVQIEQCDARNASGIDDHSLFYFYNPFPKEIMETVVDRLVVSAEESRPRRIVAVYVNALFPECFSEKGFVSVETLRHRGSHPVRIFAFSGGVHDSYRINRVSAL